MGRTNVVLLAMGIAAMLVMSLLMKQFLHKAESKRSPVVQELSAMFGGRLDRDSKLVIERTGQGPRAVVTVYPMLGIALPQLARDVGEYVWRRIGDEKKLVAVDVVCQTWSNETPQRISVPKPYFRRATDAPRPPAPEKVQPPAVPPSTPARAGR